MKDTVRWVCDTYGTSILLEEKRFCSIVYDRAPGYVTERKVLHRLCDCHLLKELYYNVVSKKNVTQADYLRFVARLREEGFSDEWIKITWDIFGLPINVLLKKSNNIKQITNTQKPVAKQGSINNTKTVSTNNPQPSHTMLLMVGFSFFAIVVGIGAGILFFDAIKSNNDNETDVDTFVSTNPSQTSSEEGVLNDETKEASSDGKSIYTDESEVSHRYQFVHTNISWQDAWYDSIKAGGYLARIETEEEYRTVVAILNSYTDQTINYVYLGGMRDHDWVYRWRDVNLNLFPENIADDNSWYADYWYPGEPSFFDSYELEMGNTIEESYMSLMHVEDDWYFNDASGFIADEYPDDYGKIGYLIEFE